MVPRRAHGNELTLSTEVERWLSCVDSPTGLLRAALTTVTEWTSLSALALLLVGEDTAVAVGFVAGAYVKPLIDMAVLEGRGEGVATEIRWNLENHPAEALHPGSAR